MGVTWETTRNRRRTVFCRDAVAGAAHPLSHFGGSPAGWSERGVSQPAPVQLRMAFGGLGRRAPLPLAEVGFDEVVVDGDREPRRPAAAAAVS